MTTSDPLLLDARAVAQEWAREFAGQLELEAVHFRLSLVPDEGRDALETGHGAYRHDSNIDLELAVCI